MLAATRLILRFGVMAALFERRNSGRGQFADAAMIDGVAPMTSCFALRADGVLQLQRESGLVDGGMRFYHA